MQLFEAAAGIGSFGPLREALRTESEEIWTPRRSRDRTWYQAHDAYEEARRAVQAATVTVTRWRAANDACDTAQAELAAANGALEKSRADAVGAKARNSVLEADLKKLRASARSLLLKTETQQRQTRLGVCVCVCV